MDQETKNKIKEFAPPLICLDGKFATAGIIYASKNEKSRMAMLKALYADSEKQHKRYLEQTQEWEKTKKKLEKHKTRNVKIEKMFNKQF